MRVLVTGCAGFIGSNLCRHILKTQLNDIVIGLDALTYAGNLSTMEDLERDERFTFHQARIEDADAMRAILKNEHVDAIVNCAAETHNDRSLLGFQEFLKTNVIGVDTLLALVRELKIPRIVHVSTDEVYGSTNEGSFTEQSPLQPNTPYSASKAAGDLQCRAHFISFQTPVVITRGGNTYGPYQYPEKLIPFFLSRFLNDKKAPLYGEGNELREWIHVEDHAAAIDFVLRHGEVGEVYNVGDTNELPNKEVVRIMLDQLQKDASLIQNIPDPRGGAHDKRYSMNSDKLRALGWKPNVPFEKGLRETVDWYAKHQTWWRPITAKPEYQAFIKEFYGPSLGENL